MGQNVENNAGVGNQLNITDNSGPINFAPVSRLAQRFISLKEEITNQVRFDQFIDDLKEYNTLLDGKSMTEKLIDGGFSESEIKRANRYNLTYLKKAEKNRFYESAQKIDVEIFGIMVLNFETYVEPLIVKESTKEEIKTVVTEKVITPILDKLNTDGGNDSHLNYTATDIMGMLYFLTGKCHINWANYDNI